MQNIESLYLFQQLYTTLKLLEKNIDYVYPYYPLIVTDSLLYLRRGCRRVSLVALMGRDELVMIEAVRGLQSP